MRASAPISRGVELGYAEITSAFTVTRAGSDLTQDITNLVTNCAGWGATNSSPSWR
jgi:hypothetical protein